MRAPGEPNVLIALTATNEITENTNFDKETARRNILFSTKFYLKILCNDIEACKTKFLSLSKDFKLEIEEIFSLQLTNVPKYLTIELYEQPKSLLRKKLCDINIEVPVGKSPMQMVLYLIILFIFLFICLISLKQKMVFVLLTLIVSLPFL